MSTTLSVCSRTGMSGSEHDRYSALERMEASEDDTVDDATVDNDSTLNSSIHHGTTASESGYSGRFSGTYGASFVSDESGTLEYNDEYDDIDAFSMESEVMVGDEFVDSACVCLDYPAEIYHTICSGRETSLLRQSKSRSRGFLVHGAKPLHSSTHTMSAARNRSIRLKNTTMKMNAKKTDSAMEDSIRIMRIQPKEPFEVQETVPLESKEPIRASTPLCSSSSDSEEAKQPEPHTEVEEGSLSKTDGEALRSPLSPESVGLVRENKQDPEEISSSMLEGIKEPAMNEENNSETQEQLSSDSLNEAKLDPPVEPTIVTSRVVQGSMSADGSSGSEEDPIMKARDQYVTESDESMTSSAQKEPINTTKNDAMQRESIEKASDAPFPNSASNENSDDMKSKPNSLEIIDVLSMDDQDSWIPGSRDDNETGSDANIENVIVGEDTGQRNQLESRTPKENGLSTQDERRKPHETKVREEVSSESRDMPIESKLVIATDSSDDRDVFDDFKAREAFLDRRQGQLRAATISNSSNMKSPPRKIIRRMTPGVLDARNPPSPEMRSPLKQSESGREKSLAIRSRSKHDGDMTSNESRLRSRKKDLLAIHSIEEGQRRRAFLRAAYEKKKDSKQGTNMYTPIDVHRYVRESPYDETSTRSPRTRSSGGKASTSPSSESNKRLLPSRDGVKDKDRASDQRDDKDSFSPSDTFKSRQEKQRPAVDKPIATDDKLRKLETKVKEHLRELDYRKGLYEEAESRTRKSADVRSMEKKLSTKLRSVKTNESEVLSSREIRRLEEQLAQKLNCDSGSRASRLQRIKRRLNGMPGHSKEGALPDMSPELVKTSSPLSGKHSSSTDKADPTGKYEYSRGIRSRYVRRGTTSLRKIGSKNYSKMTESG